MNIENEARALDSNSPMAMGCKKNSLIDLLDMPLVLKYRLTNKIK